jgi:peptidoglycan/xylan/chitin deacetylase (PgdA/CDA1 family)
MHRGEVFTLALAVPATVLVAFWAALGPLLAVPVAVLTMSLLPFALAGRSPSSQWRLWLAGLVAWAWVLRDQGGVVSLFAWFWLVAAALNLVAAGILVLGNLLAVSGREGVRLRMALLTCSHLGALWVGFAYGLKWGLVAGAALAAGYCLAVLRPNSQWLGPVRTGCGDFGVGVLITIDDGPDPRDTPVLLEILDRYRAKAIFFMIGEKAARHPELVREVIRRGHQLGNHTMTHPQASFWCAGPGRTRREITDCQQVLEEISGQPPRWFRAPVGHRNFFTHPVTQELGLEVAGWNRRGFDAVETVADKALARLFTGLGDGDIVLLHEATPIAAEVLSGVLEKCAADRLPTVFPSRSGGC